MNSVYDKEQFIKIYGSNLGKDTQEAIGSFWDVMTNTACAVKDYKGKKQTVQEIITPVDNPEDDCEKFCVELSEEGLSVSIATGTPYDEDCDTGEVLEYVWGSKEPLFKIHEDHIDVYVYEDKWTPRYDDLVGYLISVFMGEFDTDYVYDALKKK